MITIVFDIRAGYFNWIFATHPDSRTIQAILLVLNKRSFFFHREWIDVGNSKDTVA